MGCIINKRHRPKQKPPVITINHDSSNTINPYSDNHISTSEKIIVLKPLPYKNTLSPLNNNTYIHSTCSSNIVTYSINKYTRGKTLILTDDIKSVDGLNISQRQRNTNIFNTQLYKKLYIKS